MTTSQVFIYSCSQTLKTMISKEINKAEHEYMSISPPPPNYRSSADTATSYCLSLLKHLFFLFLLDVSKAEAIASIDVILGIRDSQHSER